MEEKRILPRTLLIFILLSSLLASCGSAKVVAPYIRVLEGTVEAGAGGSLAAAQDNSQLPADATIKTSADGRAALFFNDGSQVEVEPDTQVTLQLAKGIGLAVESGQVWVASNTTPVSVDAGGPVATATGAGFSVTKAGDTVTVTSVGGTVELAAGGSTIEIPSGQQAASVANGAPSSPEAIKVENALRIVLEGEALAYVADPDGRAVGYHPTKEFPVSLIPNAWYSAKAGRPQVISVPNLIPGEYTILLVAAANQSAWKIKVGTAGPDLKYEERGTSSSITWGTPTGITLKIDVDENGAPVVKDMSAIWTLYVDPPGKAALGDTLKRATIVMGKTPPPWAELK